MTAEVTVLNRQAVALAADSAVTISRGKKHKIFNTVNKLFRLSLNQPIGIMVYGAASIFSVPWETIIKLYRNEKQNISYDSLEEYANCFFKFLTANGYDFFPDNNQTMYVELIAKSIIDDIFNRGNDEIKKIIEKQGVSDRQAKEVFSSIIKNFSEMIKNIPDAENELKFSEIKKKYSDGISKIIDNSFEKLPLYKKDKELIINTIAIYFTKAHLSEATSGIVFAGFGDKEFFPTLNAYKIDAVLNNKLRIVQDGRTKIDFDNGAEIRRFAQGDMVSAFIEGIDPRQSHEIDSYVSELFNGYPKIIVEKINNSLGLTEENSDKILKDLKESSEMMLKKLIDDLGNYRHINHISPILNMVSMLPKEELAVMAETLVNLTSFKKKMTMEAETVGGPIDVAVITKGDGFTWVKRKGLVANRLL